MVLERAGVWVEWQVEVPYFVFYEEVVGDWDVCPKIERIKRKIDFLRNNLCLQNGSIILILINVKVLDNGLTESQLSARVNILSKFHPGLKHTQVNLSFTLIIHVVFSKFIALKCGDQAIDAKHVNLEM